MSAKLDNLKTRHTTPTDVKRANAVSDYIAAFARAGVPQVDGQPTWPKISPVDDQRLVIGTKGIRVEPNYKPSRLIRLLRDRLARFATQ